MTKIQLELLKQYEKHLGSKPYDDDIFQHYKEFIEKHPNEASELISESDINTHFIKYTSYLISKMTDEQAALLLNLGNETLDDLSETFMRGYMSDFTYLYFHRLRGLNATPIKMLMAYCLSRESRDNNVYDFIEYISVGIVLFTMTGHYTDYKEAIEDIVSDFIWDMSVKPTGSKLAPIKEKVQPPTLKSKRPKNYVAPNTKFANEMTKDMLGNGMFELAVGSKKEVFTKVSMKTYDSINYDAKEIKLPGRQYFTSYDRCVHNAVCSLYVAGNDKFTPEMVYRAMNGKTDSDKVSPQAVGAVTKSLEKSRHIMTYINFTGEAKARRINIDNAEMSGMILPATKVSVTISGEVREAYFLNSEPILYAYSNAIGQVISVPIELLDTKNNVRSTEEVIVIREYLLRRIEGMKNKKNNLHSNKILYESVYEELQITEQPTKQKAEKIRDSVKEILTNWKEQKYIKDFKEYKDGRSIKGLEIIY